MVKLDARDKKLLYEIDFNARKTYTELAKKLGMSKRGVEYKIKNLEKKGLILGYTPIIDLSKFGYYYFRVFAKFENLSEELRKKVEEFMLEEENIGWAIWGYDAYDLGLNVWAKSVKDFKEIINKFYFKFDKYIGERVESVGINIIFYKNRYLVNGHSVERLIIGERKKPIELDPLDKNLLKLLVKNPRGTIVDFASKLKESPQSILYRFKRLKKGEILLGIRPDIDHNLLNKIHYKLFMNLNNLNPKIIKALEDHVSQDSGTLYIVRALGICDFDIEWMGESPKNLFEFIEELQNKFPGIIRDYKILFFDKTIKIKFLPENL